MPVDVNMLKTALAPAVRESLVAGRAEFGRIAEVSAKFQTELMADGGWEMLQATRTELAPTLRQLAWDTEQAAATLMYPGPFLQDGRVTAMHSMAGGGRFLSDHLHEDSQAIHGLAETLAHPPYGVLPISTNLDAMMAMLQVRGHAEQGYAHLADILKADELLRAVG